MSNPCKTQDFETESLSVMDDSHCSEPSSPVYPGSKTVSPSRTSGESTCAEELLSHQSTFSDDETIQGDAEISDMEPQRKLTESEEEDEDEYHLDSTDSESSASSSNSEEEKPKSKKRSLFMGPKEAACMTFEEMREAMDADYEEDKFDRRNYKPPELIFDLVAKSQRKERKQFEKLMRVGVRRAIRRANPLTHKSKKADARWAPYEL